MDYLINLIFGLLIGFVGGYAGIGGAPLFVFMLGTFWGYPQHAVQGTVVAIMLGPMSLGGVIAHWAQVKRYWVHIVSSVLTYAIFSYFGATMAYCFSSSALRLVFAAFLFLLGIHYVMPRKQGKKREERRIKFWPMTLLGSVVGVVGGLFGVGAGVLLVPLLILVFGMHKDDARAISLAMLLPPVSLGAVLKYHANGDILWPMVWICFIGYFLSNYAGAQLGKKHPSKHFKLIMGFILLICAGLYTWQTLC